MLQLNNIALRRGASLLFSGASAKIHPGQKVGITGANGAGKSSLFALILGDLHADAGHLDMPSGWVVAHVAQETPADARPALDYVLDGDAELRQIEAALFDAERQNEGERIGTLHAQFDAIGGYTAPSRAARLLHGLGFAPGQELRPVDSFSGGWRMRLNLARALMCRSDLLLLDEPTNHLDLDAVIWLEDWLRCYQGTLLMISHDRDFLDAICTQIAHIEQQGVTLYPGNYSAFERIRAERLANQQAAYESQQRELKHIQSYVDRFRAQATKARQAQSRLKALERMELIAPAHVDSPFHFSFFAPEKNPNPLLRLDKIQCGYGEKTILSQVSMSLSPGQRVGLLGPNGAGKSTLIKLLAGVLQAGGGKVERAADLKIGYFAQHQLEQLQGTQSPLAHLRQLDPVTPEQELRDYLGGFDFRGDKALAPVAPFSGGEKSRLALALLIYQRPNLLLLDEPTNHLDLEMRQALAMALQEYEGAMLIVSHDRHLLRVTTDQLFMVHGGQVQEFDLDLDEYPKWLADQRRAQAGQAPSALENAEPDRKDRKRREAEQRAALKPLRDAVVKAETNLARLHAQQAELNQALAAPELYEAANKDRLKQMLLDKANVDTECEQQELAWLEASEALEAAIQ